jgi:myo-inositol-1(or 4)-monophosphatase
LKQALVNDFFGPIKKSIVEKISEYTGKDIKSTSKSDSSPVTEVDFYISNLMKEQLSQTDYKDICFYSEEDHNELTYPAFVLDPLDGTKEFIQSIPEFSTSLGFLNSSKLNDEKSWGWIFNPRTNEVFDEDSSPERNNEGPLLGFVSRSEWNKGLFEEYDKAVAEVKIVGSIAYKLGLLAAGKCDFIISKQPKSIWDIAGGGVLLNQKGFLFYNDGKIIDDFRDVNFKGPYLWCRREHLERLTSCFSI